MRGSTNTLASTILLDLRPGDPANMLILLGLVLIVGATLTVIQQRAVR